MTSPFETGVVSKFDSSGNSKIEALAWWGYKWGAGGAGVSAEISYSFPTADAVWSKDYQDFLENEPFNGFQPFDAAQQDAAERALDSWASVANITFTKLDDGPGDTDVGDIRFGNSNSVTTSTSAAWAYFPFDNIPFEGFFYPENGDVWFDYSHAPNLELQPGDFGYSTMIHEIGHALGLDHPFPDGDGEPVLPAGQRNQRYSIMAYNTYSGATIEAYGPMLYDILAIQYIYGVNMETGKGDNVYTFQTDKEYLECIWDAGGHDTIDLSNQVRNQVIDLRAGTFSSIGTKDNAARSTAVGNVAIAFNVEIEDAVGGSGRDKITGNHVANSLNGGIGNDTIVGGAGNDVFDFDLVSELGDLGIITDFKKGLDRIDISDLLDDALYAGSDIFGDGVVTFTYDKTTTNIWFDADGAAGIGAASSLASLLNVKLADTDSTSFIV